MARAHTARRLFRFGLLVAGFSVWSPPVGGLASQDSTVVVQDCDAPCDLRVNESLSLGDEADGYVGTPFSVVQRSDGIFVIADLADQDRLKLFSPDGEFLRTVGRRGQGPGEFGIARSLFLLPGDSLQVYDLQLGRLTTFDEEFQVVDVTRVRIEGTTLVPVGEAGWVVNARLPTPEGAGLPLWFLPHPSASGRPFGADPPIEDLTNADLFFRALSPSASGAVWAAPLVRYSLEEWSPSGQRLRHLERRVDWFPPHRDFGFQGSDHPPHPGIVDIREDARGLVWVLILVPDREWSRGVGPREDPYGRIRDGIVDHVRYWDTIVEVIDPETVRVVGRTRMDEPAEGFVDDGVIFARGASRLGEPRIVIRGLDLPEAR